MSQHHSRFLQLTLAFALVGLAGCPAAVVQVPTTNASPAVAGGLPPAAGTTPPTPVTSNLAFAKVSGVVLAPARFIGHDAGNSTGFIGHDAGNSTGFIGHDAGNSTGRRLLSLGQAPLAHVRVTLTDPNGLPVPDTWAITDDNGHYELPGVIVGQAFLVQTLILGDGGEAATLASAVSPRTVSVAVDVTAASTLVTRYAVQQGRVDAVTAPVAGGTANQSAFSDAVQRVAASLTDQSLPDLSSPTAVLAAMTDLVTHDQQLQTLLGAPETSPTAPYPTATATYPTTTTPYPTAAPATAQPACVVPTPGTGLPDPGTLPGATTFTVKLSETEFRAWEPWNDGYDLDVYLVGASSQTKLHFPEVDIPQAVSAPPGTEFRVIYAPEGPPSEAGLGVAASQTVKMPTTAGDAVVLPLPDAGCLPANWGTFRPAP